MNMLMKHLTCLLPLLLLAGCGGDNHDPAHDHDEHVEQGASDDYARGPHRGRLLSDGDFSVEVTIFESGVPPEFHVYATQDGKPVDPSRVQLGIELIRLGGRVDRYSFKPEKDYLKGSATVVEPHSFDVNVSAEYAGKHHRWTYASYEGRTTIAADMAAAAGIKTATAGPGSIRETLALHGTIQPNAERVRQVVARFPGPVRSVAKQIGDNVRAGDTLAIVESNESLQTYAVTAPIAGVITQRNTNPGELAGTAPLFVIADFGSVWAELTVFARDRAHIREGQRVQIRAADGDTTGEGVIGFVAPTGSADHQTLTARVRLDNADGRWMPGVYVTATVTLAERQAPLVVANSALQTFRDFTVVFAKVGDTYEVRMLDLGKSDGEFTEVLGGLAPGTVYVTANSYLVKADTEKSGASHDH